MTMRKLLLIGAAAGTALALGTASLAAQQYPFCRKGEGGPGDCKYDTLEQCQAAVSGTAGYCQPNSWLQQTPQATPHRRARRS